MRYNPPIPMTVQPFTESNGNDQYLRQYFVLNVGGPIDIGGHTVGGDGGTKLDQDSSLSKVLNQAPIRIGDTDIHEYEDLEFEIGRPDQITLYTDQVEQSNPAWNTDGEDDGTSATRTTASNADEFVID